MIAQLSRRYFIVRPFKSFIRLLAYLLIEGRPIGTRGRFINPIIFFLFRIEGRIPVIKNPDRPVFILGTGRNGSTALGMALSLHWKIGFLNEAKALWHSVVPNADVLGNYSRSENVRFIFSKSDATRSVIKKCRRITSFYLLLSGSSIMLDKCSEFVYRVPFLKAIFPKARFIFLMRSGVEFCSSVCLWSEKYGINDGSSRIDWWGKDGKKWNHIINELVAREPAISHLEPVIQNLEKQVDKAAVEWIITTRIGLRLRGECPDEVLTIRYENLIEDPANEMIKICNFLEIDKDKKMIDYGERELTRPLTYRTVNIHPKIRPAFEETLALAGYSERIKDVF